MEIAKGNAKIVLECLMIIDAQDTTISKDYENKEWDIHFQKCRDCIPNRSTINRSKYIFKIYQVDMILIDWKYLTIEKIIGSENF